jgi:RecB family exonuclease
MLAYFVRFFSDLFWTSWSRVKTGWVARWMEESEREANLEGRMRDIGGRVDREGRKVKGEVAVLVE